MRLLTALLTVLFFELLLSFTLSPTLQAGLLFNYSQLTLKDLDQMNSLVQKKIKEAKTSSGVQILPLKEMLQAVYSRPDEDGMIDKIVGPLRTELDQQASWEKVLHELTDEAIGALKNPKPFSPRVQVTYIIFLENLMTDLKPAVSESGIAKSILEKIQNAKIQITLQANQERQLKMMKTTVSPSEIAKSILASASSAKAPVSE